MSEIGAVTQSAQLATTQAAQPTSLEAQLFSYMAQLQAQSVATGQSATLANPAMMSGELFRYLRGFIERQGLAEKVSFRQRQAVQKTPDGEVQQGAYGMRFASLDSGQTPLHAGPAADTLDKPSVLAANPEPQPHAPKSWEEMGAETKQFIDEMMVVLRFHTEATLVSGGTRKMVEDVNMLIRSQ